MFSFLSRLFGGLFGSGSGEPRSMSAIDFVRDPEPGAAILDVRTPAEFSEGHLKGARNANVMGGGFLERIEAFKLKPEQRIYVYCRSGNRSSQAVSVLRAEGYARAVNVGGFDTLVRAGATPARKKGGR